MSSPMSALTSRDLHAALDALHAIGEDAPANFARRGVGSLSRLIGSDLTTLSVCDLDTNHRSVVSDAPGAISPRHLQVFDRYFDEHPLVRAHGRKPGVGTRRISDLVPVDVFHETPLYNEYYRAIGIRHAMAVPIYVDGRLLVSFVFNRAGSGFGARELELAEAVRPHLASLYRLSGSIPRAAEAPLTAREREVLEWVAAGKTNRDIAAILGAKPRTIEKHLERIYEKLGVETRTAAAARARLL
jgi:DNA-binding CsgD family transcriptional regulator